MNKNLTLLLLVGLTVSTVVPHLPPIVSHAPLTYRVNIEDPPEVRWKDIIRDYHPYLERIMLFFDILPIPKGFFDGVEWWAKNQYKHQDFIREVEVIAELSGMPFEKLIFLNFMYEFSTVKACSSILVKNTEGKVIHGRNMDFEMWELVSKLMVNVAHYKEGKLVYTANAIAGMAFTLTGIRHGAFAISEDTRFTREFSQDLISVLKNNNIPAGWLIKKVFQEESNYADAVHRLKMEHVSAPIYFIVSGVGEGVVIEREIEGVHAAYELSEKDWFIVQTNYDRDEKEPVYDPRRIPVENKLKKRGREDFSEKSMMDEVMAEWPTFNIATIVTAIMVAESGFHNTTIWYGENPPTHMLQTQ